MGPDVLTILKGAREILAEHFCKWFTFDANGNHCALGALGETNRAYEAAAFEQALHLTDAAARRLHPQFAGAQRQRADGANWPDRFDLCPTVFVNNHLGQAAILEVFDEAITQLELDRLCAEEETKQSFSSGSDPVCLQRASVCA